MKPNKTVANNSSVEDYISSLSDKEQVEDSRTLIELFKKTTGEPPVMWGGSIIGFGSVHLTYASGRTLDWMKIGFSPRAGKLSLYVTNFAQSLTAQYPDLGKYKIGKGCIYIRRLSDVDINVLEALIKQAAEQDYEQANRSDGNELIVKIE